MKIWKLFLLFFASCLLQTASLACGWFPMPEEVRVSVFGPDLMRTAGYEPFFYTRHFLYDYEGSKGRDLFWEENLTEWESCLGHIVKRTEIDHFLSDIPYVEFDKASSYVFEKEYFRNTDLYRISPVARYLVDNDENEVLAYFFFAKAAERLVNPINDPNSWKGIDINEQAVRNLIAEMQGSYKRISDPLLKMRYAYQMVMLSRYIEDYPTCISIYDRQIDPHQQSSQIRWLALLHKGAALARLDRLDEANLAFAQVFENCPGRRARGFVGFDVKHADTMDISKLSSHDQGLILAMRALKHPGQALSLLKTIETLIPNHEIMNLLLIREINKLEEWVLTPRFSGYNMGRATEDYWEKFLQNHTADFYEINKAKDQAYAAEVLSWSEKITGKKELKEPGIWKLGNAHLALIKEDFTKSQYWLDSFGENQREDKKLQNQADMTALLSFVQNRGETDAQLLQRLYPLLQKLEARINYEQELKNNPWFVSREAKMFGHCLLGLVARMEAEGKMDLAAIFMAKVKPALAEGKWTSNPRFIRFPGQTAGAQLYPLHANYNHYLFLEENADIATVEKLLAWASKRNLSDWESYFLHFINRTEDRILFSLSRMYMRENSLGKALSTLQKIDPQLWNSKTYSWYLNNDPFQNPLSTPPPTASNNQRNPVEMVERMIQVKAKGQQAGEQQASYLEELGHAYYHMSYYGNYWIMYRCWQSSGEDLAFPPANSESFAADYYGCARAKGLYQQAFDVSTDRNQQVRLLLLMASCEEKHFAWKNRSLKYQDRQLPVGKNPFYKQLKAGFQAEKKFVINQCDRLKYYL